MSDLSSYTVAWVGLERSNHQVTEGVGVVEVCAIVYSPKHECPIAFPFDVSLSTYNYIAGTVYYLCV